MNKQEGRVPTHIDGVPKWIQVFFDYDLGAHVFSLRLGSDFAVTPFAISHSVDESVWKLPLVASLLMMQMKIEDALKELRS